MQLFIFSCRCWCFSVSDTNNELGQTSGTLVFFVCAYCSTQFVIGVAALKHQAKAEIPLKLSKGFFYFWFNFSSSSLEGKPTLAKKSFACCLSCVVRCFHLTTNAPTQMLTFPQT